MVFLANFLIDLAKPYDFTLAEECLQMELYSCTTSKDQFQKVPSQSLQRTACENSLHIRTVALMKLLNVPNMRIRIVGHSDIAISENCAKRQKCIFFIEKRVFMKSSENFAFSLRDFP